MHLLISYLLFFIIYKNKLIYCINNLNSNFSIVDIKKFTMKFNIDFEFLTFFLNMFYIFFI